MPHPFAYLAKGWGCFSLASFAPSKRSPFMRQFVRHQAMGNASSIMEPFRIHVADEVLDDLRARLRQTRWTDQVPGIGWGQGTDLDWLRRLVSYWANEFDWRAWEHKLNALDQFTWNGIHFVHQRAASGRGLRSSSRTAGPAVSSTTLICCRCSRTST